MKRIKTDLNRREFLASLGAMALAGCVHGSQGSSPDTKPNILLIFIDDLGHADLGCYGLKDAQTPNIDSLARDGVRFTDGYVTASVCSPSRAGILTGRYQHRFGHEFNINHAPRFRDMDMGLPTSEVTIADSLKEAGYVTGAIGKWHLGHREKYHPMNRGFDEYFGYLTGAHGHFNWNEEYWGPIYRDREPVEGNEYLQDAFSRESVDFIRRHKDEPFFLYLSCIAVHGPMQATKEDLDRHPDISNKMRKALAAMLSSLDDGVGEILETLRETGQDKDTLIFCISDNGGQPSHNASLNTPFRAGKGSMYEGGNRIPYIMKWPGQVPGSMVYEHPVSTLDVFPTALAAAGGRMPNDREMDGVDLMPYLAGRKEGTPHELLFWRRGDEYAVRKGDWKLVRPRKAPLGLYNLSADIKEENDLIEKRPEKVRELANEYTRWCDKMTNPLWNWNDGTDIGKSK
ncbi:sulfatase [Candidatus Hydrogenedentota bacterium]